MVYHGISQPIRALTRSMSACRTAGHEGQRGVAGVEVGEVSDLVGQQRTTRARVIGPPVHAGLEEGAVDDQLATPCEQVEQSGLALRPVELVLLVHGQPGHPSTSRRQRVAGAGQLLLLHQHLAERGLPFGCRHGD